MDTKKIEKEMVAKIIKDRALILDRFSEAYIAETGLCPSQCELIEEVPQLVGKDFKKWKLLFLGFGKFFGKPSL